jgi:hypothetical protein
MGIENFFINDHAALPVFEGRGVRFFNEEKAP